MSLNLQRSVEVAVPIDDPTMRKRLWNILNLQISDNRLAWDMQSSGNYVLRTPQADKSEINSQKILMDYYRPRMPLASWDESGNNFLLDHNGYSII